jgi:undecaprenyl-diphosphatase
MDSSRRAAYTARRLSLLQAILLGIVQGLTEFLPVSSTAHLYLAQALLGIANDEIALSFDIVLHLGTAAALILATRRELAAIVGETLLGVMGRPARDREARALVLPIVVGTIPGALAGLFLLKRFEAARTPALIGLAMLAACAFFVAAEALGQRQPVRPLSSLGWSDGLWVGIAQAAAGLLAGLSRSGFTISTGRLRGLRRDDSARFSFLLALPIILGAGAKALLDLRKHGSIAVSAEALAFGFLASAVSGYFAVGYLLRFLRTRSLRPFAVYLGLLGLALLGWSLARRTPLLG